MQYPIPLTLPDDYARARFYVSPCNAEALALIEQFPRANGIGAVIIGPKASGKTHLTQVWAARVQAKPLAAIDALAPLMQHVVVDDAENQSPETLFHLLNNAKASSRSVLLTCSTPPAAWSALPDLTSRLNSFETAMLSLPDEAMLAEILQKYFTDQQLEVGSEVTNFLTSRIERSFASAREVAEKLNFMALSEKRAITVPLARRLFNEEVSPAL